MTFALDIDAATDAIAALEDAIATPSPGITNSYLYGANPVKFDAGSTLPAIVHIQRGPLTITDGAVQTFGKFELYYDIDSLLLIMETIPDQYPGDEGESAKFWVSVCDVFFNLDNQATLISAAGASDYNLLFNDLPAFAPRPWPPTPSAPLKWFWSLQYTHRFMVDG